jgi:HSP20 family protein
MSHPLDFWRGSFMSPPRENRFQSAFDRLFEDWAGARLNQGEMQKYTFNPSCEVTESKTAYLVKFDLPGVPKEQIKIDLHEGYLTVSGERKEERKEEDKDRKRHFSEVFYGSFSRSFSFPTQVDAERVEARFDNGVLTVNVPKAEASRARQISVR